MVSRKESVLTASFIIWFLSFVVQAILIVVHLVLVHFKKLKNPVLGSLSKLFWNTCTASCICFTLACIKHFIESLYFFSGSDGGGEKLCRYGWYVGPTFYFIAKALMYIVYLIIMYLGYLQFPSLHEYSYSKLRAFGVFIIGAAIMLIFIVAETHENSYVPKNSKADFTPCIGHIPGWVSMLIVLNDVVTVTVLLSYYLQPIFKIKKFKEPEKKRILYKIVILAFVGMFSTFFFQLLIVITESVAFQGLDDLIHTICLLLFHHVYLELYVELKQYLESKQQDSNNIQLDNLNEVQQPKLPVNSTSNVDTN